MRNTVTNLLLGACFAGMVFGSCAPVYVANRLNSPLFDDGGQANFGVGYGEDGVSLNAAVSPVNSLAFIGNYSTLNRDNQEDTRKFDHTIKELGVGYFNNLPLKGEDENFFYEGFIGVGFGDSKSEDYENGSFHDEISESEYRQLFIQPSLGYRINQFALAGSIRMNFVNFNQLKITKDNATKSYNDLKANSFAMAGTLYGWFDPVRIGLQAGFTGFGQREDTDAVIDYDPLIFNLSVEYTFRGRKEKLGEARQ